MAMKVNEVANLEEIQDLVRLGAIFFVSHSGGKDSQAMYEAVRKLVPMDQIHVVHADLGDLEHEGTYQHILATTTSPITVAHSVNKAGDRVDLFDMVRARRASLDAQGRYDAPAMPSSAARFCTSDLKTGPIWREIRQAGDYPIVVNCVGIRADESASRAKKVIQRGTLMLNKKNTNSKRDAYDWWPIAHWSDAQVWDEIGGVEKAHPAYAAGNERLSCEFCIFGSRNDLRLAKERRPELYKRYIDLEIEVRTTMFNGESLAERIA